MKKNLCALIVISLIMFSCGASKSEMEGKDQEAKMDSTSVSEQLISSSAAVEKNKDTLRKFIRTADLKFKVKNIIKSTVLIEDFAVRLNGFVILSNLTQNISRHTIIGVSQDSSLETTYYQAQNNLIIRVPNTKLDSFLKQVAIQIEFLDYRVIKANDVGLQVLENKLTQQRIKKHEERLTKAIDEKGKKLSETSNAEETILARKEQADNAMINNLSLLDEVNYSTVSLQLYQKETIKRELLENEKNTKEYEPGFWKKTKESLANGWYALETIVLFLINAWAFILIGAIIFFVYHKYKKP